jgi:Uma2 family endonuclease
MTVDLKHLTYAEYLALPEMKARYSIVDGELVRDASPTPDHQTVLLELAVILVRFVREHRLGKVFTAPLDIVIRRDPLHTRQPDLMFISNARRHIIGRQVIEGGPGPHRRDLVAFEHATRVAGKAARLSGDRRA